MSVGWTILRVMMAGGLAMAGGCEDNGDDGGRDDAMIGYSWSAVPAGLGNIVHFHWLRMDALSDPAAVKAATDAMPAGRRVIFLWDVTRDIVDHPDDRCRDAAGNIGNYESIWLDNGVARVNDRLDDFFRQYKRLGGKLDMVVLDEETGLTVWHLGRDPGLWQAIQGDPRFAAVAQKLGFADLMTVANRSQQVGDSSLNYLRWNALMRERMADYLNRAVYDPIRAYYPNVKLSNYGYYHHTAEYGVPDRNGHRAYLFGMGSHVGTHQAQDLYTRLGHIGWNPPDGVMVYAYTPFNGFRYAVNKMRSMVKSSDVPIYPWIAFRGFSEGYTGAANSDLYQELIFHVGLSGAAALLYWNPRAWRSGQRAADWADDDQDRLFSGCLSRLTELVGTGHRTALVDGLVAWSKGYVLSGMQAGDRTVWRFTPELTSGTGRTTTLVSASPAVFRVGDEEISIPGGDVMIPGSEFSSQGYWITAPADVQSAVVTPGVTSGHP